MEAVAVFIASFSGASLALYLFFTLKNNPTTISGRQNKGLSGALHGVKNKLDPPKGVVLRSPEPEEERKRKYQEWEKKAFSDRLNEGVSLDFRGNKRGLRNN